MSESPVPIRYYSLENTSKFCAEGYVKNLLNMLRLSEHDVSLFWDLATAPLHSISEHLCDVVQKIVCNHFSQVNSIEKCLWILRKQFKFIATKKMKLSYFTTIKNTLQILQLCHFSILLLVNSKNAVFDHVVVIWQGRVIHYESKNIYILTKESSQQICGANTFFSHVSCGYGLFLPAGIWALSLEITNWGKNDFDDNKSTIRKFFNKKLNRSLQKIQFTLQYYFQRNDSNFFLAIQQSICQFDLHHLVIRKVDEQWIRWAWCQMMG